MIADDLTFQLTRNSPYYTENTMLEQHDWNETPDSDVVPTNLYYLTVTDLVWEYSQNGKLLLRQQFRIEAPDVWKGANIFNRIYIGTDDDPGADLPETWKRRGGQDVKKFLVGVFGDVAQLTGHIPTDVEATRGASVLCLVNYEQDNNPTNKDGTPNEYFGQERNRFKKWYPPTDPDALAKVGQMAVPETARPGRPAAAPRPAGPPTGPAPATPRPPAAPPAAAPSAPPAVPSATIAGPPAPPTAPRTTPQRPAAAPPPRPPAPPAA